MTLATCCPRGQDLCVHVEGFDARPGRAGEWGGGGRTGGEAFRGESAGKRDVGDGGGNGEGGGGVDQ